MGKIENKPTWVCDRCKKEHIGDRPPNTPRDAWGKLKIDQDSGFDANGFPWCPRMREPLLLCGECIEEIVSIINDQNIIKKLELHKDSTVGLWATDRPDLISEDEKEKYCLFEIEY